MIRRRRLAVGPGHGRQRRALAAARKRLARDDAQRAPRARHARRQRPRTPARPAARPRSPAPRRRARPHPRGTGVRRPPSRAPRRTDRPRPPAANRRAPRRSPRSASPRTRAPSMPVQQARERERLPRSFPAPERHAADHAPRCRAGRRPLAKRHAGRTPCRIVEGQLDAALARGADRLPEAHAREVGHDDPLGGRPLRPPAPRRPRPRPISRASAGSSPSVSSSSGTSVRRLARRARRRVGWPRLAARRGRLAAGLTAAFARQRRRDGGTCR